MCVFTRGTKAGCYHLLIICQTITRNYQVAHRLSFEDRGFLLEPVHRHCVGLTSFQEGVELLCFGVGGERMLPFQNGGQINQLTIL